MSLTKTEQLLVESVKSLLNSKMSFGVPKNDPKATDDNNYRLRGVEFLHEQINEMFQLKAAELTHHTGICAAFSKVHSYKYIEDETFSEAMGKELTAQGIPKDERTKALEFIPTILKELKKEIGEWGEADFGFHPDLDEIQKISQPNQYET
jgi:hypothetical protein